MYLLSCQDYCCYFEEVNSQISAVIFTIKLTRAPPLQVDERLWALDEDSTYLPPPGLPDRSAGPAHLPPSQLVLLLMVGLGWLLPLPLSVFDH